MGVKKTTLYVTEYLNKHKHEMVSVEQLIHFLIEERNLPYNKACDIAGEHRGKINTYAKKYLLDTIGSGARNSQTLMRLYEQIVQSELDNVVVDDTRVIVKISGSGNGVL